MSVRVATHAGSWYSKDAGKLNRELQRWLAAVPETTQNNIAIPVQHARAIIAPHAGYAYSGATAAYAYKCIDTNNVKRVFILGPSHHVHISGCALPVCTEYATPFGSLKLDDQVIKTLRESGHFEDMSKQTDEAEHSIEMHLPYLFKIMEQTKRPYAIVPILVGALNRLREEFYGKLLAPYLADPDNLFIISSDFCHWGSRFSYTFYSMADPPSQAPSVAGKFPAFTVPIHSCIERLDREGMHLIEGGEPRPFHDYLKRSRNTICGRHPISVLMWGLEQLYTPDNPAGSAEETLAESTSVSLEEEPAEAEGGQDSEDVPVDVHTEDRPVIRFVRYAQSNRVMQPSESSVSYASAYVFIPPTIKAKVLTTSTPTVNE